VRAGYVEGIPKKLDCLHLEIRVVPLAESKKKSKTGKKRVLLGSKWRHCSMWRDVFAANSGPRLYLDVKLFIPENFRIELWQWFPSRQPKRFQRTGWLITLWLGMTQSVYEAASSGNLGKPWEQQSLGPWEASKLTSVNYQRASDIESEKWQEVIGNNNFPGFRIACGALKIVAAPRGTPKSTPSRDFFYSEASPRQPLATHTTVKTMKNLTWSAILFL
jgi:hypothetical protein